VTPTSAPDAESHESLVDVFVARQPIFDARGELFAYELLYRKTGSQTIAEGVSPDVMTSEVFIQAFLTIGLDKVASGQRAFLNFTREMLLRGMHRLVDPSLVVIELLETVAPTSDVVATCQDLVKAGYTLALDDFVYSPAYVPLLRIAKIVKLDVLGRSDAELRRAYGQVAPFGGTILAERVETKDVRDRCAQIGYRLFQGFYFSKPETLARRDLSAAQLTIIRLMKLLRDPNATDTEIDDGFRADLSLTYKLLRSVNSASLGGRGIESIRHAVRLIGREELCNWLSLLLVTSVAGKGGTEGELVRLALQRGRFCETIGVTRRDRRSGALFMVGLFSLLDAILKLPLKEVLDRIDLAADIRAALLERTGPYALTLRLVEAYERADWPAVLSSCDALFVDKSILGELYTDAARWTREQIDLTT
jgi:EAL and modified HD-GYP domain-containing signal transduction protein